MKSLRIILALSLCGAVSTSHALISRFSKPLMAGFASSIRAKALRPKFVLGSGLLGTGLFSSYAYQQKQIQENKFKSDGKITIKNLAGDIEVEGWDHDRLHVEISKEANDQATLNDITFETNITDDVASVNAIYKGKYTFDNPPAVTTTNGAGIFFGDQRAPLVNYTVKVPRLSHVVVKNQSGNAKFKNILGSIDTETWAGDIETDCCSSVTSKSMSGSIKLFSSRGCARAHTMSGNALITGSFYFPLQEAHASSISGNVSINGAKEAYGKSVIGNVEVRGAAKGSATSTTGNAIFFGE
ncbi:MAG: hypothetical protein ACHQVS_05115 [Candidatus Babeliales bacterium]